MGSNELQMFYSLGDSNKTTTSSSPTENQQSNIEKTSYASPGFDQLGIHDGLQCQTSNVSYQKGDNENQISITRQKKDGG